jgi:uncharacterized protein with von Willebrand factor type A (vWA) domain
MGLDDFLEQLREEMRSRYRQVNLRQAFADPLEKLEELLDLERAAFEGKDPEHVARRRDLLDRLPPRLSDALDRLREAGLEDPDARQLLEELLEELDNIRDLEDFTRRYGDLFHGPESLSYAEALELMRTMERLKKLEEELLSGDLDVVSLENLRNLLGAEAGQNFQALKNAMLLIVNAGYLSQREGRLRLSPKGVRKIGQLALRDIYQGLLRDRAGGHQTDHRGSIELRPEETKSYQHGDPLQIDLVRTLKKALLRRPGTPLDVRPEDFEVFTATHTSTTSTVLLLDMSWSMSWEGRFAAAKKVAMAMEALIRSRYPRDFFAIVGFFTRAVELKLRDLPEASWNMGDPFTNLQDGLRLAGEFVERMTRINKGRALYTRPDHLGEYLLVDYLAKKRRRV